MSAKERIKEILNTWKGIKEPSKKEAFLQQVKEEIESKNGAEWKESLDAVIEEIGLLHKEVNEFKYSTRKNYHLS